MSVINLGVSLAILGGVLALIYARNRQLGLPTPPEFGFFEWFRFRYHWNDLGHVLGEFMFVILLAQALPLLFAMLVPAAIILFIELFIQKNIKNLLDADFLFDLATHAAGILAAGALLV